MKRVEILLDKLKNKENFSIARFNDGEIMAMMNSNAVVARGDQKSSKELSHHLINAILHKDKNYYIGVPCKNCFPGYYEYSSQFVDMSAENVVPAVIFTNRNWQLTIKNMKRVLEERRVIWVSGENQNLDILKNDYGLNIVKHIKTRISNSYSQYNDIVKRVDEFENDDVIILSCGPLSRILSYEWWKTNPNCTYLDVGSLFDPFTKGLYHNCHKWTDMYNNLTRNCDICNIPSTPKLREEWNEYIKNKMEK